MDQWRQTFNCFESSEYLQVVESVGLERGSGNPLLYFEISDTCLMMILSIRKHVWKLIFYSKFDFVILALQLLNCACFTWIWIWYSACAQCHTTHTCMHWQLTSILVYWSNCVIFLSALIVHLLSVGCLQIFSWVSWWPLHYFQNLYSLFKQNIV